MAVAIMIEENTMSNATKPVMNAVVSEKKANQQKRFFTDIGKVWTTKNDDILSVSLFPGVSTNEFSLFVAKEQEYALQENEVFGVFVIENDTYWHRVGSAFAFVAGEAKGLNVRLNGGIHISGKFIIQRKSEK